MPWGFATGAGLVAAVFVVALAQAFDEFWRPVVWRLAFWLWDGLGLVAVPSALVAHAAAGTMFGLVLSGTQTLALGFQWRARVQWLAVSTAATLLVALAIYIFGEIGVIEYVLWTPYRDVWAMTVARAGLAVVLGLCFALPTGLCMRVLRRRDESPSDAAVLRRFD